MPSLEAHRFRRRHGTLTVEWPRGEATACKAVYTGSNPVSTSSNPHKWAVGAAVARFPDTEEVAGSIPVPPTNESPYSVRGFVVCQGVRATVRATTGSTDWGPSLWLCSQVVTSWCQ